MIRLVIFDWNGTLLADDGAALNAANERTKLFGLPPQTKAVWRDTFEVPIVNFYKKLGVSTEEFEAKSEAAAVVFTKYFEAQSADVETRIGVKTTLQALKKAGIGTVILSNHNTDHIEQQLNRLKISDYIDDILANQQRIDNHFKGKEDRLKDYKQSKRLRPSEIVIVGDTAEEVKIGKAFGFTTVGLSGGYVSLRRLRQAQPDFLIHKMPELLKVIESLR